MSGITFNFEVEPFVWNKGFKEEPGGTEAKQEARRKVLVMGNNGKKQWGQESCRKW